MAELEFLQRYNNENDAHNTTSERYVYQSSFLTLYDRFASSERVSCSAFWTVTNRNMIRNRAYCGQAACARARILTSIAYARFAHDTV